VRAWVAVTDKDWYRFLSRRPDLEEVNFWQPGGSRLFGTLSPESAMTEPACPEILLDWRERPVRQRLGQGAFRVLITDVYERRCAVTGEKALPVLHAAHIRPVTMGGWHRVDNGLLLRSDIHALFDQGYVTVTPNHRFLVSRRLKTDFDNGELYYPLSGKRIWLPGRDEDQHRREFLGWHADAVYRG
jgi:predicted restriction endonuclease